MSLATCSIVMIKTYLTNYYGLVLLFLILSRVSLLFLWTGCASASTLAPSWWPPLSAPRNALGCLRTGSWIAYASRCCLKSSNKFARWFFRNMIKNFGTATSKSPGRPPGCPLRWRLLVTSVFVLAGSCRCQSCTSCPKECHTALSILVRFSWCTGRHHSPRRPLQLETWSRCSRIREVKGAG